MNKKFIHIGCIVLVGLLGMQCAPLRPNFSESREEFQKTIRISLVENAYGLTINCPADYQVIDPSRGEISCSYTDTLHFDPQSVFIGRQSLDLPANSALRIQTKLPEQFLEWNGKKYRGALTVIRQSNQSFQVINELPVEDYLRSVVPLEIGKRSPAELEVLKTQAVAARTYAVKRMGSHVATGFDLYADIRDQVYGGVSVENENCDRAIQITAGEVLVFGDSLVDAYYHSTCGGRTERVENIWKNRPAADYLVTVRDQGICKYSPLFRWEEVWTPSEMERIIKTHLKEGFNNYDPEKNPTDRLVGIKILSRFPSGRISALQITMTSGDYVIPSDRVRWVLRRVDHTLLKSSLFKLSEEQFPSGVTRLIRANGAGYGHGVGMCQWGAIEMGREGVSYYQILEFYYPGTILRKIY